MTKTQLKSTALELLVAHKANKQLTAAISALMEEYSSKKSADKIEKFLTIDGQNYVWCNRHEIYEIETNFKNNGTDKSTVACELAAAYWLQLSKDVREHEKLLSEALDAEDYAVAKELNAKLKDLKATRSGKYDFTKNAQLHPEVKGYDYGTDRHHRA